MSSRNTPALRDDSKNGHIRDHFFQPTKNPKIQPIVRNWLRVFSSDWLITWETMRRLFK